MRIYSEATESSSARYFALLYSPASQQIVLEALFGVEREVLESLRPGIDHQVAHSRLKWWREECERASEGRAVHPLTRTLVDTLKHTSPEAGSPGSALQGLSGFVDVAVWDLAGATFESRRELTAYCERWASAMIGPIVHSGPWQTVGAAMREVELLGDLAREAHHGRLRLPLNELDRAKADPSVLASPPWPDAVAEIVRARYRALRDEIAHALAEVDREQQSTARGLLVWAALAWRLSQRAERALPDRVRRSGRFDAISDAWFAWRMARRATMGRFRLS
ncbi:MAG: squalene/phytoene synthase family protein [Sinobacteraceae bacterium]|nr:squalene/phytoene synthase family protein [Nevskiaceae bacterium]